MKSKGLDAVEEVERMRSGVAYARHEGDAELDLEKADAYYC